jgi:hypothetical protein
VIIYWQYTAKQQLLNQESSVSEVLNRYKKGVMGVICLIMDGMANVSLMLKEDYMLH